MIADGQHGFLGLPSLSSLWQIIRVGGIMGMAHEQVRVQAFFKARTFNSTTAILILKPLGCDPEAF